MAEGDWSESKAWMRATRERIGMTQHDVAVLANLTVDMVKKYESEKYRIQPSDRMKDMLEHLSRRTQACRHGHRGTPQGRGAGHALRPRRPRNGAPPPGCSRRRSSPSTTPTCPKKRTKKERRKDRSCSDSTDW